MRQFIQIGERVRKIGPSKYRYDSWKTDKWLEAGVMGTVVEFHEKSPAYTIRGEHFEGLEAYAVVRWDNLGTKPETCIESDYEGQDWERVRVVPMTSKTGREGRCYELALKYVMAEDKGTLVHGVVWSNKLGQMIGHAWVLVTPDLVWEPVSNEYFLKDWLYKTFKMKEERRYTPVEAITMTAKTRNYGPW